MGLAKPPLILLTGGLRTPSQFVQVLLEDTAQILGLGRLAVLCPDLPNRILSKDNENVYQHTRIPEPVLYQPLWIPKLVGAGAATAWYNCQLKRLAEGKEIDMNLGSVSAIINLFLGGPYEYSFLARQVLFFILALASISSLHKLLALDSFNLSL